MNNGKTKGIKKRQYNELMRPDSSRDGKNTKIKRHKKPSKQGNAPVDMKIIHFNSQGLAGKDRLRELEYAL